jgi:acyl dehydratase
MTDPWSTSVTVSDGDHEAFVRLSGDGNPLHTDPLAARRLPFGRIAVHGLHVVLLALDLLAAHDHRRPTRIRCTLRHSVGPGDTLHVRAAPTSADVAVITVHHDAWKVADLEVRLTAPTPSQESAGVDVSPPDLVSPRSPSQADMASASGSIAVEADIALLHERFPNLELDDRTLAELVTLTRLVGVYLPGEHSLFSSFDVSLGVPDGACRAGSGPGELTYSVRSYDDRFSKVVIDIGSASLGGSVTAFVRPAPVHAEIGSTAPPDGAFSGQRWLVVGGSRGLGATSALLLAAGGADVRITYRTGAGDAAGVAAAIDGSAHALDVADPEAGVASIRADGWHPTHVAYFASPPIFDGVAGSYSHRLEARFRSVYVDALQELLDRLDIGRLDGLFWPSSTAADGSVPGLAEYAVVKREGESVCAAIGRRHPELRVVTPRLPRLLTDQTTSFVPVDVEDAPSTLLRALLAFSG